MIFWEPGPSSVKFARLLFIFLALKDQRMHVGQDHLWKCPSVFQTTSKGLAHVSILKPWNCCPHKKLLHPGVVGEYQWDRPLQSDHVLPATPCPCSYQLPMLSLLCHTQPSVTQCAGQLYSRALSGVWGACEWYLIGHTPAHSDLPAKQSTSCPTRLYFWRSEHIYEGSDWCQNLKMGHLFAVNGKTSIHSFVDIQDIQQKSSFLIFASFSLTSFGVLSIRAKDTWVWA